MGLVQLVGDDTVGDTDCLELTLEEGCLNEEGCRPPRRGRGGMEQPM